MFAVSLCYGFTEGLTDVHERIRHTGFQQMVTRCVCMFYVQVSMIFVLNEHTFRGSAYWWLRVVKSSGVTHRYIPEVPINDEHNYVTIRCVQCGDVEVASVG